MPQSAFRHFLRDAALLLIPPATIMVALLLWWHPWEPYPGAMEYRRRLRREQEARLAGVRALDWYDLHIQLPEAYILTTNSPVLEVLEAVPLERGPGQWPSRMAFLELDSTAAARFAAASANCELAADRCWSDTVGVREITCQRSAGVPDPGLAWTPHLECQVPSLGVRIATNAPQSTTLEFLAIFHDAVASVPPTYPGAFLR